MICWWTCIQIFLFRISGAFVGKNSGFASAPGEKKIRSIASASGEKKYRDQNAAGPKKQKKIHIHGFLSAKTASHLR